MTKKVVELNEAGLPTGRIVFTFDDESTQVFDLAQVNENVVRRATMHGFSQKIGDSYAGAANSGTDPVAYAKAAVADTIAQLYAGDWRASSAGSAGPRVTDLALAVSRVTGKDVQTVVELLDGLDDDGKKALKSKPKVKAMLALIAAEKATKRAEKAAAAAGTTDGEDDLGI